MQYTETTAMIILKACKLYTEEKGINEFTEEEIYDFIINNPHKFTEKERDILKYGNLVSKENRF